MFVDKLSETHYSQTFIKKSRKFVVKCPLKGLFSLRLIRSCLVQLWLHVSTSVILGTPKDGNLQINSLASNYCFSYRNVFQNGANALFHFKQNLLLKA